MSGPGGQFSGYQCWKGDRIKTVFNLDAIAVDSVNFLATHSPLNRIQYTGNSPQGLNNTGEDRLLGELQRLSREDQYAFVVVEGMPGSGKSHLIRWLKEQYAAQRDRAASSEVVLLIERANSSLRGTLRQIVESDELRTAGIYDERGLAEQIDRLRHAADLLSEEALGDSLLNALQVAATEVKIPDEPGAARLLQNNAAGNLLLDQTFRSHLKRPGGPIERLTNHLAKGRESQQAADELPGFDPDDLMLGGDLLQRLKRVDYPEVQLLAGRLGHLDRPQPRKDYAEFLNRRLNFAVGRATSLSADDIKQVFNDLRRALRARGYHLMLFIEDVTSFTGIDAGLIDVLATQHTGQENTNFARLISVVGITNDYYQSRFPQNMKQRVTHHLRLSSDTNTTMLLEQADSIADVASRYLNATRLNPADLEQWTASGARQEAVPNACTACPFKIECHASFGYVSLDTHDDESQRLGLYPFNRTALRTMFDNLHSATRTPRSLLVNVVESTLVRHGWRVGQGTFPPAPIEMRSDYTPPTLIAAGAPDRVIRSQAPHDSERLESLLVLWGDRTANSVSVNGARTVGSLPEGVFRAFQLKFIPGISGDRIEPTTTPPPTGTTSPPVRTTPPPVVEDPVLQDIRNWRAGQQLQRYESLRKGLTDFAGDAIDWEAHQIGPLQIGDRINARRYRIEGQAGRTQGDVLELPRSDELQYALQAVHALGSPSNLDHADLAGHLLALRAWLDVAEPAIVAFVKKPHSDVPDDLQFADVLTADALHLASLEGHLLADDRGVDALTQVLLQQGSAAHAGTEDQFATAWRSQVDAERPLRSKEWSALRQKISAKRSHSVWSSLLGSLNRSQGGASGVRFVDADLLIGGIERFRKSGWNLDRFEAAANLGGVADAWAPPLQVLRDLHDAFPATVEAEREFLAGLQATLHRYLDGEPPETLVEGIRELLRMMREHNLTQPYSQMPLNSGTVTDQLARLKNLVDDHEVRQAAFRLSKADRVVKGVQDSIAFFGDVESIITKYEPLLRSRLDENQRKAAELSTADDARAQIKEIIRLIDGVTAAAGVDGVRP